MVPIAKPTNGSDRKAYLELVATAKNSQYFAPELLAVVWRSWDILALGRAVSLRCPWAFGPFKRMRTFFSAESGCALIFFSGSWQRPPLAKKITLKNSCDNAPRTDQNHRTTLIDPVKSGIIHMLYAAASSLGRGCLRSATGKITENHDN